MKNTLIFLISMFMLVFLISCSEQDEQTDIVTTMYTHYDLAKHIAGDELTVSMLVPLGQDIHSFEATSKDMISIENAKLFLYTSDEIDTWISDPNEIGGDDTIVVNMSEAIHHVDEITLLDEDHDHDHHEDVHYWVDPMAAIDMLGYILDYIVEIDPDNASYYQANSDAYEAEILNAYQTMHDYFDETSHQHQTIYFAGHNAMSAFGERFDLTIEALFSEFKPDEVLTSIEIENFSEAVRTANVHYLFIEDLEVPTAANAIKEALHSRYDYELTLLKLGSYHNVSQDDFDQEITYVDLMNRNFNHIAIALGE